MSYVDGHCDTLSLLYENKQSWMDNSGHIDLRRLSALGNPVQFFAVWIKPEHYPRASEVAANYISFYFETLKQYHDIIRPVLRAADIESNKKAGRVSAVLSLEGGESIGNSLSNLKKLYTLGVRMMSLTWNHPNLLATGMAEKNAGLTVFGRNVISLLEELGIIIDVSHIGDQCFWEIYEQTKVPFVASHSNARAVCASRRNLTDAQIKAIAERGGVIGVNLFPPFLSDTDIASMENVLEHIAYMINIAGADCVALGCDFDGITKMPEGIRGCQDIPTILAAVESRFGSGIREKIAEKNFLRLIHTVWKSE